MRGFFHFFRKRTAKRNFCILWLCLVALELLSHSSLGQPAFAADVCSPAAETSISVKGDDRPSEMNRRISGDQDRQGQKPICQDEASHHDILISGSTFPFKTLSSRSEQIISRPLEPVYNSLPPPYIPPKRS